MRKRTLIGKQWDRLTVIAYDAFRERYECHCTCGGVIWLSRYQVIARAKSCCEVCKRKEQYLRSIQIDRALLRGLDEDLVKKIVRRFVRHVRLSHDCGLPATSFQTFVTEIKSDPEMADDDPVMTIAERVDAVTWQHFPQYASPRFSVGGRDAY